MSGPDQEPGAALDAGLIGRRRAQPAIHLSALIDVLFIVLVFVVLAARFDQPRSLEVTLPRAGASDARQAERAAVLEVPRAGPMRLDGAAVTEDRLAQALRQVQAHKPTLLLVADGGIPLDRATRLLDAATAAGFSAVSIATRDPGAAPTPATTERGSESEGTSQRGTEGGP